jgi:uncharacterized protein involved in oxidation of intracellular sulfur
MKILLHITSPDPETRWNALRFANLLLGRDEDVTIFLDGPAVEYRAGDCTALDLAAQARIFALSEGVLLA